MAPFPPSRAVAVFACAPDRPDAAAGRSRRTPRPVLSAVRRGRGCRGDSGGAPVLPVPAPVPPAGDDPCPACRLPPPVTSMEVAAALAFAKLSLDDVEIVTDAGPAVFAGR